MARAQTQLTAGPGVRPAAVVPTGRGGSPALVGTLVLCSMAFAVIASIVSPMLPAIAAHLHAAPGDVTWVLTAYLISASVATPVLGRIGDVVGKRRTLLWVLACFAAGSLLAAVATSLLVLILARVLQGVAGAIFPLAFGVLRDRLPAQQISRAVGLVSATMAVGGGLALVLVGPVTQHLGYRAAFLLPVGLTFASLLAAAAFVPETAPSAVGLPSVLPALLLSAGLVTTLVGISEGSRWGWASPALLGCEGCAFALFAMWGRADGRAARPMLDLQVMRVRPVMAANLVALLLGMGMYGSFAILPSLLLTGTSSGYGLGLTLSAAGPLLVTNPAGFAAGGLISSSLLRRLGARATLALASGVAAAGYALLALRHADQLQIAFGAVTSGLGIGIAIAALPVVVIGAVAPSQTGMATGINANLRLVGGAVGAQLAVTVVAASGSLADGSLREQGFVHGFEILAVLALVAATAAVVVHGASRTLPDLPTAEVPASAGELGRG